MTERNRRWGKASHEMYEVTARLRCFVVLYCCVSLLSLPSLRLTIPIPLLGAASFEPHLPPYLPLALLPFRSMIMPIISLRWRLTASLKAAPDDVHWSAVR